MKPHWYDLTEEELDYISDGCTFVPDFIFTADCRIHDFNYARGGTVLDKIDADWEMCRRMWSDSVLWWHYVVTIIYWGGLTFLPISYFVFHWGYQYNDIQTILLLNEKSKKL